MAEAPDSNSRESIEVQEQPHHEENQALANQHGDERILRQATHSMDLSDSVLTAPLLEIEIVGNNQEIKLALADAMSEKGDKDSEKTSEANRDEYIRFFIVNQPSPKVEHAIVVVPEKIPDDEPLSPLLARVVTELNVVEEEKNPNPSEAQGSVSAVSGDSSLEKFDPSTEVLAASNSTAPPASAAFVRSDSQIVSSSPGSASKASAEEKSGNAVSGSSNSGSPITPSKVTSPQVSTPPAGHLRQDSKVLSTSKHLKIGSEPKLQKLGTLAMIKDKVTSHIVKSVTRTAHVRYDPSTGTFTGLPSEWEPHLNKHFGLPILLCRSDEVEGYDSRIPRVLVIMRRYLLENGGRDLKGIFRLAPDQAESELVKQQLNSDRFEQCQDVNCVSNLIKVWFRDLPAHVMGCADPEQIKDCSNYSEEVAHGIVDQFPEPNRSVLLWLLDLCCDIVENAEVNMMTAKNMAICVAPNLYRPKANVAPMEALVVSKKFSDFLEMCIRHRMVLRRRGLAGPGSTATRGSRGSCGSRGSSGAVGLVGLASSEPDSATQKQEADAQSLQGDVEPDG